MLLAEPPRRPVYPSGEELAPNMVAIPFSLQTTGPLTHTDVLNIGFYDESGDPRRCQASPASASSGTAADEDTGTSDAHAMAMGSNATAGVPDDPDSTLPPSDAVTGTQPYACRLLVAVNVLDVNPDTESAYLELTPYQAQAIRAVQAASLPLFAERATTGAAPLPALTRLDPSQFTRAGLMAPTDAAQTTSERGQASGTTP